MDFNLNIGTLTTTIKEYEKLMVTLAEQKENINKAISELCDLGWSGDARDKFETVHNIKQQHYDEFQEDVKYIKETLENEEKPKAILLKKRCEAFVDCVARGGVSAEGTSDDEGIISLDFGGVYPIKNIIDQCTFNYYKKMNINFEDILGIINNLDYTSFNIGGDLFSAESSIRDQTLKLTAFDDSLALYYQGIQDMESNICSKLGKISGVSVGISNAGSSSSISPSGDIDEAKMQELMLKDQEKLTDLDKQSLEYIKNILGEDMYNTVKEAIINNSKINISKDPLKDLPMYNTGAGYTAGTGYNMGDRVQLCAPSGQYFAATVTLSNNVPELKFDDQDGYAAAFRGQYASVQAGLSDIVQGGIKSANSFKEIGSDFYAGLKNRGDKAIDSPYDFLNWATLGIPDVLKATVQVNSERSDKAFSSVYDGINWLSFGSADMVKGTFDPEDPLSKEHWLNSFGTASVIFGGRGATSSIEKASMIDHIPSNEILNKNSYVKASEISDGVGKAGTGKIGEGIPLEEVKPDVLKQIHADDNGAYGYLPNEGTDYYKPKYDFTDVNWTKEMQNIRNDYLEASKQIESDIERMQSEGFSKKDIANHVVDARNQQKVAARENMTADERAGLEARNIKKYKNPIGPTAESKFNEIKDSYIDKGIYESDDQICDVVIQKSMQKDDVINTLLGIVH